MKAEILNIDGSRSKEIELPEIFSVPVREDIILKVFLAQLKKQPYAPELYAGMKYSASGIIAHQRRKWKTAYGIGISRIPRKIMLRRGSRFFWVGATVAGTRGGRRAHPPKILSHLNIKKINQKEKNFAFKSAIASTADVKSVQKKYQRFNPSIKLPIIVSDKITDLKIKEIKNTLKNILRDNYILAEKESKIRAGKGKARGRKYKKTRGILIVISNNQNLKCKNLDVVKANSLSLKDIASGGIPGRLTIYTENAIKDLWERLK